MSKSLFEITGTIANVENMIESAETLGEDTQEYKDYLETLFGELQKKANNIDFFLDSLEVKQAEILAIAKQYEELAKTYKKKATTIDNSKKRLLSLFETTGLVGEKKKFETAYHSYYLAKSYTLEVSPDINLESLPNDFKKIKIELNKIEIKKAISAGLTVPGFFIEEHKRVQRR